MPAEVGWFANNEDSGNTSQNYPITQFWQEVNIEHVQKSRAAGKGYTLLTNLEMENVFVLMFSFAKREIFCKISHVH